MLSINEVPLKDRWRLTTFEVMKYDPKYRNNEGHYLKKEWKMFSEIGKLFEGGIFTYEDYKVVEDKYISAIKYLFEYYNCSRIQFSEKYFYLDDNELHIILDEELIIFYHLLKKRRILNLEETGMAARLILRSALYGSFNCKGDKNIAVRFGYDFYMYFNTPEHEKQVIKKYIEKEIGLFTSR